MEEKGLAMEMLAELKAQSKRWFTAFVIALILELFTIFGFIWYLNQYDYSSTIEQTGVYTFMDSEGNVISTDIDPEQMVEIMEIINNGDSQGHKDQD